MTQIELTADHLLTLQLEQQILLKEVNSNVWLLAKTDGLCRPYHHCDGAVWCLGISQLYARACSLTNAYLLYISPY